MEEGVKKAPPASPPPPDFKTAKTEEQPATTSTDTTAEPEAEPAESAGSPQPAAQPQPQPAPAQPPPLLLQQGGTNKGLVVGGPPKLVLTGKPVLVSAQNLLNTSALILHQGGKAVLLQNIKPVTQQVVQQTPQPIQQHTTLPHTVQLQQPVQQIQQQPAAPQQQPQQQQQQQQPATTPANQPGQPLLPRRGLSLTREQMLEAQDMFRNANRVTRPEKALILGFMAGSRDNPCPNLGNIVTIKLSENIENVLQSDDTYLTMLSEMHFQMNYNNGQWTRLKKYRHIDGMVPQKIPPGSTVISANNQQPVVSIANQSVS